MHCAKNYFDMDSWLLPLVADVSVRPPLSLRVAVYPSFYTSGQSRSRENLHNQRPLSSVSLPDSIFIPPSSPVARFGDGGWRNIYGCAGYGRRQRRRLTGLRQDPAILAEVSHDGNGGPLHHWSRGSRPPQSGATPCPRPSQLSLLCLAAGCCPSGLLACYGRPRWVTRTPRTF